MYLKSPMEKYNKNNPFIIIAKKVYDGLIDTIHSFGRLCIELSILIYSLWLTHAFYSIYTMIVNGISISSILTILVLLTINILIVTGYRRRIRYFISDNLQIQEFARLSKLEVNDILALNNEELLKCVYGLHELRGELKATVKYYTLGFISYSVFEILIILIAIL